MWKPDPDRERELASLRCAFGQQIGLAARGSLMSLQVSHYLAAALRRSHWRLDFTWLPQAGMLHHLRLAFLLWS